MTTADTLINLAPTSSFARGIAYLHLGCELYVPVDRSILAAWHTESGEQSLPEQMWQAAVVPRPGLHLVAYDTARDLIFPEPQHQRERYMYNASFMAHLFQSSG